MSAMDTPETDWANDPSVSYGCYYRWQLCGSRGGCRPTTDTATSSGVIWTSWRFELIHSPPHSFSLELRQTRREGYFARRYQVVNASSPALDDQGGLQFAREAKVGHARAPPAMHGVWHGSSYSKATTLRLTRGASFVSVPGSYPRVAALCARQSATRLETCGKGSAQSTAIPRQGFL